MSQGVPSGYVLPTPQRAKLVGVLNIVFASLLLIYIGIQAAMLILTPTIMRISGDMMKDSQLKLEQKREADLAALKKEAAEAKTDEEKAQLAGQIKALENEPKVTMPDMNKMWDAMRAPGYQVYVWSDLASGFLLNLAMLISGIGLLRLKERSRKLAIGIFGLKIARLCILAIVLVLVILPITSKMSADMMSEMTKSGAPIPTMGEMSKIQAAVGTIQAALGVVFGSFWPILGLVLLTRPGTRAACLALTAKPSSFDQGLS